MVAKRVQESFILLEMLAKYVSVRRDVIYEDFFPLKTTTHERAAL